MTSNSFRTIITKPTRITDNSSTLIDHIWINNNNNKNDNNDDKNDNNNICYIYF